MRRFVGLLAVALMLSGCAGGEATVAPVKWPAVADPVGAETVSWARGSTIYRYGAEPVDAGDPVLAYAMAGAGYLAVLDTGSKDGGNLHQITLDGTVEALDVDVPVRSFGASPDGRFLAYDDESPDETDDHGTPLMQMVVVDLSSGKEVVRSSEGFDGSDDLADSYEEHGAGFAGITDDAAYFTTLDGVTAIGLPDGGRTTVPDGETPWVPSEHSPALNPAGTWEIVQQPGRGAPGHLRSREGRRLDLDLGHEKWWLVEWIDDETVLGETIDATGTSTYVACTVPDGACRDLDGSQWQENTPAPVVAVNRPIHSSRDCCT